MNIIGYILSFVVFGSFFALLYFNYWITYWIFYKPFYMIFKNSLYLPFCLYIGGMTIIFVILLVLLIVFFAVLKNRSKSDTGGKIFISIAFICFLYFIGGDIYKDIIFIGKENYLTTECNMNSLRNYKNRYFSISSLNTKQQSIKMNFYQYNELKKEQNENIDKIIVVYYLPTTRRMLKYE